MATYVNPLRNASVTPERIDQGVDYAGSGQYDAIGACHVDVVAHGGWGYYGNYIQYTLTEPGELHGMHVYYAEGVRTAVTEGHDYPAGHAICYLIPGWHSGTEIGWAAGYGYYTWAHAYGGGYDEHNMTAAGKQFSDLVGILGGPRGVPAGVVTGTAPNVDLSRIRKGGGGGPGGFPIPLVEPPPVSEYDYSPYLKDAWAQWGLHGRRARDHAHFVELYLNSVSYCTTEGPR